MTTASKFLNVVMFFGFSDITFIHEGNKTFHDNLVNFEKLVIVSLNTTVVSVDEMMTRF